MLYRPRIFQFLSIQQPAVMVRLLRKLTSREVTVVLDLEDGLWDVIDPGHTPLLKSRARTQLIELARCEPRLLDEYPIGVRVNGITSTEFPRDLAALAAVSQVAALECVVLTKVESPEHIAECLASLELHKVRYNHLVPIVETKRGINNLGAILTEAVKRKIGFVTYGHFDYSLDAGHWPFLQYDEAAFWEHVTPIIRGIENAHLVYVHPPLLQLCDDERFAHLMHRLSATCTRQFGVITFGTWQTNLCEALSRGTTPCKQDALLKEPASRAQDKLIELAESIKVSFQANRRPNTGFALDSRTGEFISPHIYLAAVRFLEGMNNGGRES